MTKRVILDVDTGIDDAIAVSLAVLSPELEVAAITTVSGNVHVDKTSINTLRVLENIGVKGVPVAKGMSKPLVKPLVTAEDVHGSDGLGDLGLPQPKSSLDARHAVDLIIEEVREHPGDTWIITTAPITNLAVALLKEPEIADGISGVISMIGAFNVTPYGYGNVTPVAEFNAWSDPEALKVVLESGVKIRMVGLDVTMDPSTAFSADELEGLENTGVPAAVLAARLSLFYIQRTGDPLMRMHDPLAVAAAIVDDVVEFERYPIYVDVREGLTRGQTIADRREKILGYKWGPQGYAGVAVGVNGEKFKSLLVEKLTSGPR